MAGVGAESKYQSLCDTGGLDAVTQQIQSDFEKLPNTVLHIAVTGPSVSGKSSFINALRSVDDGDEEEAAAAGETETTEIPTEYPYPNKPSVRIWDLPGIGTQNFQASGYFKRVNFDHYDFFIIIIATRFHENDLLLAKEIQQRNKKFYFVRNKIDRDLQSAKRCEKTQYNEKTTLDKIWNDCVESLKKEGLKSPQVFLISSLRPDKFDFWKLQDVLEGNFTALKGRAFLLPLPNITSSIIEKKKNVMMGDFEDLALQSAAYAAMPFRRLVYQYDINLLVKRLSSYRTDFGLDDGSLGRLAKRVGKRTEELRSEVKSTFGKVVSDSTVENELTKLEESEHPIIRFGKWLPLLGTLFSANISHTTIGKLLEKAVKEMAEDSKRVLAKAFQVMD